MSTHQLKIWPEYFKGYLTGKKTCEVRRNDRDFVLGDLLILNEYEPDTQLFTGRTVTRQITHITNLSTIGVFAVISSGESHTPSFVVALSLAEAESA